MRHPTSIVTGLMWFVPGHFQNNMLAVRYDFLGVYFEDNCNFFGIVSIFKKIRSHINIIHSSI